MGFNVSAGTSSDETSIDRPSVFDASDSTSAVGMAWRRPRSPAWSLQRCIGFNVGGRNGLTLASIARREPWALHRIQRRRWEWPARGPRAVTWRLERHTGFTPRRGSGLARASSGRLGAWRCTAFNAGEGNAGNGSLPTLA